MLPVVILAGGIATRLRPLTETIPKALVDINGEPFIARQLQLLHRRGITRVVICAGYRGEMIQECIGSGAAFGVEVEFVFDGPRLLGTAGAIKKALPHLGAAFFVLYGDSYLTCDYCAVQAAFEASKRLALMTVFRNDGRWDRSNVELENRQIRAYDKRRQTPRMHYIDYGLGVLNARALAHLAEDESADLAVVYEDLLHRGEVAAFEVHERFYEIGSFSGLEETRLYIDGVTNI